MAKRRGRPRGSQSLTIKQAVGTYRRIEQLKAELGSERKAVAEVLKETPLMSKNSRTAILYRYQQGKKLEPHVEAMATVIFRMRQTVEFFRAVGRADFLGHLPAFFRPARRR